MDEWIRFLGAFLGAFLGMVAYWGAVAWIQKRREAKMFEWICPNAGCSFSLRANDKTAVAQIAIKHQMTHGT